MVEMASPDDPERQYIENPMSTQPNPFPLAYQQAVDEVRMLRIAERLGWRNIIIREQNGKRYMTGINPETGKEDLIPNLPDLQREAVVGFMRKRLDSLQDPEMYEAVDKLTDNEQYEGADQVRDFTRQDDEEAEVLRDCLAKIDDGTWTWEQAHAWWFQKFQEIHKEVLRAKAVSDEYRHGPGSDDSGRGGGHDDGGIGPGGPGVYPFA